MAHTAFYGVTLSGKTTLARAIARELQKRGQRVVVFDPLMTETAGGNWGEKAQVFNDPDDFLDWLHSEDGRNAHVFIDEAHYIVGHDYRENLWLLTQGRHYHLQIYLISQRPTKLHPDARTNCGKAYVFRLARDDMTAIGQDYGHSDLHKINLDKGDFLLLNSGSAEFSRANVFQLLEKEPAS